MLFLAAVWIQSRTGAATAQFGQYPDESAHFVAGVLTFDYFRSMTVDPYLFAAEYYFYRPYFAVGYWPPLFYWLEGLWFLFWGVGRAQAMTLIALTGAAVGYRMVSECVRMASGWTAWVGALAVACAYLFSPGNQWNLSVVMTDLPVTLFSLLAISSLASWVESQRLRPALWFGAWTGLALLTKYSAGYLLVLLGLVWLLTGKVRWGRQGAWWSMWAIPLGLIGPWIWFARQWTTAGFASYEGASWWVRPWHWWQSLSEAVSWPALLVLSVAWVALLVRWRQLGARERVWLLVTPAVGGFLWASPVGQEARYSITALAALGMGLAGLVRAAPAAWQRTALAVLVGACAVYAWRAPVPRLMADEAGPVVESILTAPQWSRAAVLVPTLDEGIFVAGFTARENDPTNHILVRPSKLVASMDWLRNHYQMRTQSPADMAQLLRRCGIRVVILRGESLREFPHDQWLRLVVQTAGWRLVRTFAGTQRYEIWEQDLPWDQTPAFEAELRRAIVTRFQRARN